MTVPSPLREQIAHAIREAQAGYGYRPHRDAAEAAAHAVLPLVEAVADAAAKAQLVESQLWISERAEAIRQDERLRLHTQLRDRIRAHHLAYRQDRGRTPNEDYWDGVENALDAALAEADAVLGVAATPQPEAHP